MADLPKWKWGNFLNEGFQNEFQEGYIEITPDAGIPFRRLRFSDIQDIVSGSISLKNSDYLDFMSWYKYEIRQGTIPFIFYDCRVDKNRTARLTMQKPQFSRFSNRWNIALTLTFDSEILNFSKILAANPSKMLKANGKLLAIDSTRYL